MVHLVRVRAFSLIHVDLVLDDILRASRVCTGDTRYCCHHIGSAIAHCHNLGIVHRDIKLENIALHGTLIQHGLRLLDFGLAEHLSAPTSNLFAGTKAYRAPANAVDGTLGCLKKADVWSFGITLFALSHGYMPMSEADIADRRFRMFQAACKKGKSPCEAVYCTLPPTALRPNLSEPTTQLLNRMLIIDHRSRADAQACMDL